MAQFSRRDQEGCQEFSTTPLLGKRRSVKVRDQQALHSLAQPLSLSGESFYSLQTSRVLHGPCLSMGLTLTMSLSQLTSVCHQPESEEGTRSRSTPPEGLRFFSLNGDLTNAAQPYKVDPSVCVCNESFIMCPFMCLLSCEKPLGPRCGAWRSVRALLPPLRGGAASSAAPGCSGFSFLFSFGLSASCPVPQVRLL